MSSVDFFPATSKVYNFCHGIVQDKKQARFTKITVVALGAIACIVTAIIDLATYPLRCCLKGRCSPAEKPPTCVEPSMRCVGLADVASAIKSDPHLKFLEDQVPEHAPEGVPLNNELLKFQIGSTSLTFLNSTFHKLTVDSSRQVFIGGHLFGQYTSDDCHTIFYPVRREGDSTAYVARLKKDDNASEESMTRYVYIPTKMGLKRTKALDASWVKPILLDAREAKVKSDSDRIYKVLDRQMNYIEQNIRNKNTPELLQFHIPNATLTVCNYSGYPLRMDNTGVLYVNGYSLAYCKESNCPITLYRGLKNDRLIVLTNAGNFYSDLLRFTFKDGFWNPQREHVAWMIAIGPLVAPRSLDNIEEEKRKNSALAEQMTYVEKAGNRPDPELLQFEMPNGSTLTFCNYSDYPLRMTPSGQFYVNDRFLDIYEPLPNSFITLYPKQTPDDDRPHLGILKQTSEETSHVSDVVLGWRIWRNEQPGPYLTIAHDRKAS